MLQVISFVRDRFKLEKQKQEKFSKASMIYKMSFEIFLQLRPKLAFLDLQTCIDRSLKCMLYFRTNRGNLLGRKSTKYNLFENS